MNPQNEDQNAMAPHNLEPFPEPQTIPSGWDLSGILPETGPGLVEDADMESGFEDN